VVSVWFEGIEKINTIAVQLGTAGARVGVGGALVLRKSAHDVEATGKTFCPVDTGNLRNSIGSDFTGGPLSMEAAIGPTADYGSYVEYGTSRMAPHAYMGPALDRHAGEFLSALEVVAERATLL
jgi:hypothetical protein